MNNQIRFRAWDKENKLMLTWHDLDNMDKDGTLHLVDAINDSEKEGVVLMRWSGSKDRNEKEIYEGDFYRELDSVSSAHG